MYCYKLYPNLKWPTLTGTPPPPPLSVFLASDKSMQSACGLFSVYSLGTEYHSSVGVQY
jgi:hypothetical protein